jgi:hypothetical protein
MSGSKIMPKQGFWKNHSAAWKESGLTQQAYCEQEGISYQSFVYQHNRLTSKSKTAALNFIKAKPDGFETSSQSSGLFLMLPNGVRIGINGEVNAILLQTVLSIAGGMTC